MPTDCRPALWLTLFLPVLVCACVRAGFDAAADGAAGVADAAAPDGALGVTDSAAADTSVPCTSWGPFSAPERLAEVSSGYDDWAPSLGAGGRVLLLASFRPGGTGDCDIWQAVRAAPGLAFDTPAHVPVINSTSYETSPVLSADGLTVIFGTDRRTPLTEVWIARRASLDDVFGPPSPLDEVNDNITRPHQLSADGLTLWLTSNRNIGRIDIFVASRSSATAPFSTPVVVPSLSSADDEHSVTVSQDGLEAIFSSTRPGGQGKLDLWRARRSDPAADFGPAENLAALNTSWDETFVNLSPAGDTLYFNRDTDTGGGRDADIWVARRSCLGH